MKIVKNGWFEEAGMRVHYEDDVVHNKYGPAITWPGHEEYWEGGLLHRITGPAITYEYVKCYYQRGLRHRLAGPAVIWGNGDLEYWISDIKYSEEEYYKKIEELI